MNQLQYSNLTLSMEFIKGEEITPDEYNVYVEKYYKYFTVEMKLDTFIAEDQSSISGDIIYPEITLERNSLKNL